MESSLRERKKEATRRALYEAVLELAVAKGFDAVTVEAVADRANVSRRTFSNYFPNKEAAEIAGRLGAGPDTGLRSRLLAAVFLVTMRTALSVWSEHPGHEPPSKAIEAALRVTAEQFR